MKSIFKTTYSKFSKKLPWKRDNKNLYIATCSQLSYYLDTAVQIDINFVYQLPEGKSPADGGSPHTDDRNEIYCFGIEKACVITRNYIPFAVVISTTLNLLSVPWLIVYAIHFTAHEAQIFSFWRMCSIFSVIIKRVDFCFSI